MLACAIAISVVFASSADAKIEAIKGKRYSLHKVHGPHMILVATLHNVDPALRSEGMSAEEAADEIVYQLRRIGIPAYVFHQEEQLAAQGKFISRQAGIAIMAGNFPEPGDKKAQKVLKYIQNKFHPAFLQREENGAIIAKQAEAKPFRRAFVVANPLRSSEEMGANAVTDEMKQLNSDNGKVSLLKNKGRYSVKVATFRGKTIVQVAGKKTDDRAFNLFGESDESATSAWELATALRQARKYGYERNYEAWVLHNRSESYVTVGSFDSPDDPRIRQLMEEFKSKSKPNPKTGRQQPTPELFSIPKNPVGQSLPDKLWFFDQKPRPVRVPGR